MLIAVRIMLLPRLLHRHRPKSYCIHDRMPRPIIPSDKFALNNRIVERLADQAYEMELDNTLQPLI